MSGDTKEEAEIDLVKGRKHAKKVAYNHQGEYKAVNM